MSLPSSRAGALALLVVASGACRARPQPSPQFAQASDLYNRLYAKSLDDAYGEPQMTAVAELLRQVDPASSSSADARELLGKVEGGMKEYAEREARLNAEMQALQQPAHWDGPSHADLPTRPTGLAVSGPTLDMTRDDFLSHFGDCFDFKGEYRQGEKVGEAYGVRKGDCEGRYKPFVQSLVVLLDNRVRALVALSDVKTITVDAGVPPEPVAAARPSPPPAEPGPTLPRGPLPPGEERVIHAPGAPDPSNAAGPPSVLPW